MCGIYGFVGLKKKPIDFTTFLNLGVINDARGGHGCGIFVDGQVEYGSSKDKYFETFYPKSNLLNTVSEAQIIVGHNRKASIGGIDDSKLQPVIIRNESGNVDFVLMHNGTLLNHEDLALKYLSMSAEESKKYTDSQIMAKIIYIHGFHVFSEYLGAGVFVMIDYRTPNQEPAVYVFKGESKEYSYSKTTTEERPLYYTRVEDGIWLSSMSNYFKVLNFKSSNVIYTFPTNKVCIINNNNKLGLVEEIDRSKCHQKQYACYYTANNNSKALSDYYDYDDYYLMSEYDDLPDYFSKNQQPLELDASIAGNLVNSGVLICDDFRFYDTDSKLPLTGIYYCNKNGDFKSVNSVNYDRVLYLFNGVPVYGNEVLSSLIDFCNQQTECINFDEMLEYFPDVVYSFSPWPAHDLKTDTYIKYYGKALSQPYTGTLVQPIHHACDMKIKFESGKIVDQIVCINGFNKFYKFYNKRCKHDYCKLIEFFKK